MHKMSTVPTWWWTGITFGIKILFSDEWTVESSVLIFLTHFLSCFVCTAVFLVFVCRIKEDHVIQHGLVVDGASLSLALREHEKLFMEVCKSCSAVLCCRMAPLQKAKVNTDCPELQEKLQINYRLWIMAQVSKLHVSLTDSNVLQVKLVNLITFSGATCCWNLF